ncbi:MAG: hypothetical protein ACIAXF_02815 [Phycisphaerales bacterium JB063]
MGPDVVELNAVLIVVGSHLRAEQGDRPLAYRLRSLIESWREDHADQLTVPLTPIVCTDLWYLNHEQLQRRPTVCIGGPGVNAYAALSMQQVEGAAEPEYQDNEDAGDRIHPGASAEEAGAREPRVTIMIDPDFTHLRVGIWGSNHELTAKGVELFSQRYLDGYLRACVTQVEPKTE